MPEEYREKIARLREYGLGEKTTYKEVIGWLGTHNGKIMRSTIWRDGKYLKREEMTPEEQEEINLYGRWRISTEKNILEEYVGRSIEEVPEEHREKIVRLREYGLGEKEKTTYEEVIEWLEENDGKIMRSSIKKNGKKLKLEDMTPEEQEETRLYAKWIASTERKILNEYAGRSIEEVPEEYREKIARLREDGLETKKRRTAKEIAKASISSLTDIEMVDMEDKELKKLVNRTKEGGIKIDE